MLPLIEDFIYMETNDYLFLNIDDIFILIAYRTGNVIIDGVIVDMRLDESIYGTNEEC